MNDLLMRYYIMADGKPDKLITSLNCLEKIYYHALRDYQVDYKYVFCDDINLKFYENGKNIFISQNKLGLNDDLFEVSFCELKPLQALHFIETAIDKNFTLAVCTMFDMLPFYCWSQEEHKKGHSNTHFCLIVGYDDDHLYMAEDPAMLLPEKVEFLESNPTIMKVCRHLITKAFEKFCSIMTVKINENRLLYIDRLGDVLKCIPKFYHTTNVTGEYCGKSALERIYHHMNNYKDFYFFNLVCKDFFFLHLSASRRSILHWCLDERIALHTKARHISIALENSINIWTELYYLIAKHTVKPNPNTRHRFVTKLETLIQMEDKLINTIRGVCL